MLQLVEWEETMSEARGLEKLFINSWEISRDVSGCQGIMSDNIGHRQQEIALWGIELFGPSLVDVLKLSGPQKDKGGQVAKLGLMQEPSAGGHSGAAIHQEALTSGAKNSQSRRYPYARCSKTHPSDPPKPRLVISMRLPIKKRGTEL